MATGSCQGTMRSIATTGFWPWLQLATVVIGGKNGAETLHTRIRPFSVSSIPAWDKSFLNAPKDNWLHPAGAEVGHND